MVELLQPNSADSSVYTESACSVYHFDFRILDTFLSELRSCPCRPCSELNRAVSSLQTRVRAEALYQLSLDLDLVFCVVHCQFHHSSSFGGISCQALFHTVYYELRCRKPAQSLQKLCISILCSQYFSSASVTENNRLVVDHPVLLLIIVSIHLRLQFVFYMRLQMSH